MNFQNRDDQMKTRRPLLFMTRILSGIPHRLLCAALIFSSSIAFATPSQGPAAAPADTQELIRVIDDCEKSNRLAVVDSLYGVLDGYGGMNKERMYKWVDSRELLRRYGGAVGLYCRLLDEDPRFADAVFGRLYRLCEDAPPDSVERAAGRFEQCALSRSGIDTIGVRIRLANFYASHGLDSAELNVLAAAAGQPGRILTRLMDMARERIVGRRYGAAIPPAWRAYERAPAGRVKTAAADFVFQAYRALHQHDSALVWIARTDMSNESRKIEAAALFQRAGRLSDAKALIRALSPSLGRDTLELRQHIMDGDLRAARELAWKALTALPRNAEESLLWNVRTLLFNGDFENLSVLLDTARPSPSWPESAEVLDCRLMLQLLRNSSEALAVWACVDLDVFIGKAGRAAGRFSKTEIPAECAAALIVRVINGAHAQGDTAAAAQLFREREDGIDSPEYLYLYAGHLLRAGDSERAGRILLRVIRDYPGGVFSEKARVLRAQIKS